MHTQLSTWLHKHGYVFVHSRMDRPTSQTCGDPDYAIFHNGRVIFCELKMPKGRLSPAQIKRFGELARIGCPVEVARSLESAIRYIEAGFGSNKAIGRPAQPNEPSGGQPEPKFWLAHSNALGIMVVTKDQTGKWCGIRVATAEDKARFPRLPAGMME